MKYIVIGGISLFGFYLFVTGRIMITKLKANGVYTLGIISDIGERKNGATHTCSYFYHGKTFTTKFTGIGQGLHKGDLIFINFLPTDPEVCDPLYDAKVPSCLTIESTPQEGWRKLPMDSCK